VAKSPVVKSLVESIPVRYSRAVTGPVGSSPVQPGPAGTPRSCTLTWLR
jgi:hypothetical protein